MPSDTCISMIIFTFLSLDFYRTVQNNYFLSISEQKNTETSAILHFKNIAIVEDIILLLAINTCGIYRIKFKNMS